MIRKYKKLDNSLTNSSLNAPSRISAAFNTPAKYYPDSICLKTASEP